MSEDQEVINPIELSGEKEILIHKEPYFSLTMNSKFSKSEMVGDISNNNKKKQPANRLLPKRKSSRLSIK